MSDDFDIDQMLEKPFTKKERGRRHGDHDRDDDSETGNREREHHSRHKRKSGHEKKKKKHRRQEEESDTEQVNGKRPRLEKQHKRRKVEGDVGCSNSEARVSDEHRDSPRRRRREEHEGFGRSPRRHGGHKRHRVEGEAGSSDGEGRASDGRRSSPRRHRREEAESFNHSPRRHRSQERNKPWEGLRDRSKMDERRRSKGRSRSRERRRSREVDRPIEGSFMNIQRTPSPKQSEMSPEDRDMRTVFCMQLSTRLDKRMLMDFFSKIGKVRDVHLIRDGKSHRSKGIAYVEFYEVGAASKALDKTGTKLDGVPIIVQPSHGERNRSNMTITTATGKPGSMGPMKLYVGSLHYNITEEMLRGIFEPFGAIEELKIMRDHQTGRSAGYGFLQFRRGEDGKRALEQLNGFELAGRPIKLGSVADYQINQNSSLFDIDESDKVGFGMSATGRIQLMAKLAEGTGFTIPAAAANVLHTAPSGVVGQTPMVASNPPITTQCFVLSNMFTQKETKDEAWERELKDEVIEECNKHGGVLHIRVDGNSRDGNIYVKCPSIASAMTSVNSLHGRFFAGRQITAAYVPIPNYHTLFPEAAKAIQFIMPSNALKSSLPYTY